MFAKLICANSHYFNYNDCDFSERSMAVKDPKDLHSKEGSARVAIYRRTGIIYSYTLECPFYSPSYSKPNRPRKYEERVKVTPVYSRHIYTDIAEGVASALIDLNHAPLDDLKEQIRSSLMIKVKSRGNRGKSEGIT